MNHNSFQTHTQVIRRVLALPHQLRFNSLDHPRTKSLLLFRPITLVFHSSVSFRFLLVSFPLFTLTLNHPLHNLPLLRISNLTPLPRLPMPLLPIPPLYPPLSQLTLPSPILPPHHVPNIRRHLRIQLEVPTKLFEILQFRYRTYKSLCRRVGAVEGVLEFIFGGGRGGCGGCDVACRR